MGNSKKRILCIDNDADTCEMLEIFLSQSGYEVATATTFAEGLVLARVKKFHLYIIDLLFPDGSGIELCKQIRSIDPNATIIFYSGESREALQQKAIKAGARRFILKPFDLDVLAENIVTLIKPKCNSKRALDQNLLRANL